MNLENFKVVEISQEEENTTNGGLLAYSGWYYLSYGIAYIAHGAVDFFSYQPRGNGGGML